VELYVDGQLIGIGNHELQGAATASLPLTIGHFATTGEYFDGIIDEVGIWNRALTQEEIELLALNLNISGCTDSSACNFNPEAIWDNGTCDYFDCIVIGCTDPAACNFNFNAQFEDGSCDFTECSGCTSAEACNFDQNATIDDGSCVFPESFLDCDGVCIQDDDGDGICDELEIFGCLDSESCNFDPSATESDSSCDYSCIGCQDPEACNYDSNATIDSEQCDFISCLAPGCIDEAACNFSSDADVDDGSCIYPDIFNCDCEGNQLDALGVCGGTCSEDVNENGICDDAETSGCLNEDALNFNPNATLDDGSCLVLPPNLPVSLEYTTTPSSGVLLGQITVDNITPAEPALLAAFNSSGICVGWTTVVEDNGIAYASLAIYGDDGTTGEVDGMLAGEGFELGLVLFESELFLIYQNTDGSTLLDGWSNTNGSPMPGYNDPSVVFNFASVIECNDPAACNFDINASENSECIYPEAALDCDGNCLEDSDGDGVCNPFEVLGCTDEEACNFDALSTDDDGTCQFNDECGICGGDGIPQGDCDCDGNQLDALGVCGGDCAADADADGICDDVDDCVGAYDACGVCNGPGAIYECGCADIPEGDCDCDGNQLDALGVCGGDCNSDYNLNGVCDTTELPGCTYIEAINYNPLATMDTGDCSFEDCDCVEIIGFGGTGGCLGDFNNDGVVGVSDILAILEVVTQSCDYCPSDIDGDDVCDDIDDCIGEYDACGICNGPGEIYECGCADIPEANCDCNGNQLDGSGNCSDDCASDYNFNGVCDIYDLPGCTYAGALNYDSAATIDSGVCIFAECDCSEEGSPENYGGTGGCLGDFNNDGFVGVSDFLAFLEVFTTSCD
jgi:hypothetical protein